MHLKFKNIIWLYALFTAIFFDQLFWENPLGLNIFIMVAVTILGLLIPVWLEKLAIPRTSYYLLIPILGFALMTFFRAEILTGLMNVLITLGTLVLFTTTLLNGDWIRFTLLEHVSNVFKFFLNCFTGGILFFSKVKQRTDDASGDEALAKDKNTETALPTDEKKQKYIKFLPYLRGVLIALPILIILTILLTSADPIYKKHMQNIFSGFNLDNVGEYIFRSVYILLLAYLILSTYYFGMVESKKLKKEKTIKSPTHRFLGQIEALIILGAVNLLFLSFVILQFTYFFGGGKNIHLEGYTYSEYAVRGYFELVTVTVIALLLFYGLALVTKRETDVQRWIFSGFGILLMGLTGVILFSAFQRLSLYEAAYGFTRLRTITHISMIWIGLLLLAVIVLEVSQNMKRLAIVLIIVIFGFGLTVNVVNIDKFIVQQNINRALNTSDLETTVRLDTEYLYSLSYDSIPPLISYVTDSAIPNDIKEDIAGILACRSVNLEMPEKQSWFSFHYSRSRAIDLLQEQQKMLNEVLVLQKNDWFVNVNDELIPCQGYEIGSGFLD